MSAMGDELQKIVAEGIATILKHRDNWKSKAMELAPEYELEAEAARVYLRERDAAIERENEIREFNKNLRDRIEKLQGVNDRQLQALADAQVKIATLTIENDADRRMRKAFEKWEHTIIPQSVDACRRHLERLPEMLREALVPTHDEYEAARRWLREKGVVVEKD
jgi:polyhydroxyalkanoate synthesis regulator phasin